MKSILYLSYTGLLEPLGQSQILAYLKRLSREHQFTLITFEKSSDMADPEKVDQLKKECHQLGICWIPKIYHNKPRMLATLWDLWVLLYSTWRYSCSKKISLVHCRSYIPAMAAWLSRKLTGVPFVFDMRGLWLDEMIDANRLVRDSVTHKILRWVERRLLQDSVQIVSLTQAAVEYLVANNKQLQADKFTVIPTCVDLTRFTGSKTEVGDKITIGTMGTVIGGWYKLDWFFRTLQLSVPVFNEPSFKVITKDDHNQLMAMAGEYGLGNIEIKSSLPAEIQNSIQNLTFAILYFTPGVSKIGSAPTRMAEFLACGIPVLANRGVGDMAGLVEQYGIGGVVEDGSEAAITAALEQMQVFLADPDYPQRCKNAAVELFSADVGATKYREVYQRALLDILPPLKERDPR